MLALSRLGYEVAIADGIPDGAVDNYDVFVLQRQYSPEAISLIADLKAAGKRVVVELDDDFWHLHMDSPVRDFWYGDDRAAMKGLEAVLSAADVVTTTTEPLAKILGRFNPEVHICRNMLPASYWSARRHDKERLVIGWAGGEPHGTDLALLSGVLEQVLDKHDVDLHVVGRATYPFSHDRMTILPAVPIPDVAGVISGFDIGLAPIIDSAFNRSKSDLKFLEYSICGVPGVYSAVGPYKHAVKPGRTGLLARTHTDWYDHISSLIKNERTRRKIADAAQSVARDRLAEANVAQWEEAFCGPAH
jgi:glycosyltransferase involved in cell wall biosynthesis